MHADPVKAPELRFEGVKQSSTQVLVPQLQFNGLDRHTSEIQVPGLRFSGLVQPTVQMQVPGLVFNGRVHSTSEVHVPELDFTGYQRQARVVQVPGLAFDGYVRPTSSVSVPELVFNGYAPSAIAVRVPDLVLVGYVHPTTIISVPELGFAGLATMRTDIDVPELRFEGSVPAIAAETGEFAFAQWPNGAAGVSGDGYVRIRLNTQRSSESLRHLVAELRVRNIGDRPYAPPSTEFYELRVIRNEGPDTGDETGHADRMFVGPRLPALNAGEQEQLFVRFNIRGTGSVATGAWDSERAGYDHVLLTFQLAIDDRADAEAVIGPYCWDAANAALVSRGACNAAEAALSDDE